MSNIAFILQGPTTYYKEIIKSYTGVDNVVWSTWDDEPISNLKFIELSTIKLVISKKPTNTGFMNANLQAISVEEGVKYFDKIPKIKYFVKIRADIIISPLSIFHRRVLEHVSLNNFNGLIFIGYCRYKQSNYFLDYIVMGKKNELLNFFHSDLNNNDFGLPFPELFFQNRYFNTSDSLLKSPKSSLLKVDGLRIFWIKRNRDLKKISYNFFFKSRNYPIVWLENYLNYYSKRALIFIRNLKVNL